MNYNYEEIINNLNEGKIEIIIFSIKEYAHYKKCIINLSFLVRNLTFLVFFV